MRRLLVATLAIHLSACWGAPGYLSFTGDPPGDDEIWLPDDDTGPDDTADGWTDGVSPVIDEADAWCYVTDDSGDWWGFEAVGDDPQGAQTLQAYLENGVHIIDTDGDVVGSVALVCEDSGQCWGSAQAEHIDIQCTNPQAYQFAFELIDESGNGSGLTTVQGRYGSGPTG